MQPGATRKGLVNPVFELLRAGHHSYIENNKNTGGSMARTYLPRTLGAAGIVAALVAALTLFAGSGLAQGSAAQANYAPVNTAVPTISGTAQVGQTLTAVPGTWNSDVTATNTSGSTSSTSAQTAAVTAVATTPPIVKTTTGLTSVLASTVVLPQLL